MSSLVLKRYTAGDKSAWDGFVASAKNGLFLFCRDYMEYHADRFRDYSLIAYVGERPVALLPANLRDNALYSHQGLTFGGWLTDITMKTATMLELFERLKDFMQAEGIKSMVYKCIPHIYHHVPAEEDIYALFRQKAQLIQCDVTTVIDSNHSLPFSERRNRGINKAKKNNILVKESSDYTTYFHLLENLLKEKYASVPTHSLEEVFLLSERFPKNIRLFAAYRNTVMLAGVIIYESDHVAHVQYVASNEEGKQCGALDILFEHLIRLYGHKRYFDFGTSNGKAGLLNETLIKQKEEFGARAVAHYTYSIG